MAVAAEETAEEKTISDRMKGYEAVTESRLDPQRPVMMRLDGHRFSAFTKGFAKPYDVRIARAMVATATELLVRFHAATAYTESDEISLIIPPQQAQATAEANDKDEAAAATAEAPATKKARKGKKKKQQQQQEPSLEFNGRVVKIATLAAAYCSLRFTFHLLAEVGDAPENAAVRAKVAAMEAHFDCRVFNVPSMEECASNLVWRCRDCRRNSKMQWALAHFTTKQLCGVPSGEAVAMVARAKGLHWEDCSPHYKWGTLIKKMHVVKHAVDHRGNPVEAIRSRPAFHSLDIHFHPDFVKLLSTKLVEQPWTTAFTESPAV